MITCVVLGFGVAAGIPALTSWWRKPSSVLMQEARRLLAQGQSALAEERAVELLHRSPNNAAVCFLAAKAAGRQGKSTRALHYYAQIRDDGGRDSVRGYCLAGDLLMHDEHRLAEAELCFRKASAYEPDDVTTNFGLAGLLRLSGRYEESVPYCLKLTAGMQFSVEQLLFLNAVEDTVAGTETMAMLNSCRQAASEDPLPLITLARMSLRNRQPKRAARMLAEVVSVAPQQLTAQALLGRSLVQAGAADEFLDWHVKLPASADGFAAIWVVRGLWAKEQNAARTAIRCFWEALRRDADSKDAGFHLPQLLLEVGASESAAPFLTRFHQQAKLDAVLQSIQSHPAGPSQIRAAVETLESLGRRFEAWGWSQIALRRHPQPAWARDYVQQFPIAALPTSTRTVPRANPALQHDLSSFPLPNLSRSLTPAAADTTNFGHGIAFADLAPAAGLDFTYFNGVGEDPPTQRMYEFGGGGIGICDYDQDGRPDIYLSQGSRWPPQPTQRKYSNALFRNLGNGRFAEVTAAARMGDYGYGQGVATGDFNSDGFPDIYVGNIGVNRLYRNNGDGTFTDVTTEAGGLGERFTSSVLLADLNGDSLPDIYSVNYLAGNNVFTLVCNFIKDTPQSCSPGAFPAAQDQAFLNLGDGRFEEITASAGFDVPEGRGLGLVAADFDGSGRLSIFVANDQCPNFFFVNNTTHRGAQPLFTERAVLSGLATDWAGNAQACMGVAADDADGDGRLDLFVSNYTSESYTLYQQQSENLFIDATAKAGLREPTYAVLGFGTQFLDADLDGRPDLVVTNGHVDDYSHTGILHHMKPQFFQNIGQGHFVEIDSQQLGPYFDAKYLGRPLAVLDWNLDGRDDFIVGHLYRPVALVTNQTSSAGEFLVVQLRGVVSARDAIGATVTVQAGNRTWVRQLTAGDGYHASNERKLTFGLGDADHVDALKVKWPSGRESSFADLPAAGRLLIVEGRAQPLSLPIEP